MENRNTTDVAATKNNHTLKNPAILTASTVAGNCSRPATELTPNNT